MSTFRFGNAQHVGRRSQQQDSFAFSHPFDEAFVAHGGLCAILADGMGGLPNGDLASRTAAAAFLAAYQQKGMGEPIGEALRRSLAAANAGVCALAEAGDLGTTLVAATVSAGRVDWVSAGDSALFLCRNGACQQLTRSHVYAHELDARAAAGEISVAQALRDPQREALTCHLGMTPLPAVDAGMCELLPGDVVLLASDGLFKTLSLAELGGALRESVQESCEALVEQTLARGVPEQDNVTVVALALPEAAPPGMRAIPVPASRVTRWVAALSLVAALALAGFVFERLPPTPRPAQLHRLEPSASDRIAPEPAPAMEEAKQ